MEVLRIGNYLPNEFLADTNRIKLMAMAATFTTTVFAISTAAAATATFAAEHVEDALDFFVSSRT